MSGRGERRRVSECVGVSCDILEVSKVSLGLGWVTGSSSLPPPRFRFGVAWGGSLCVVWVRARHAGALAVGAEEFFQPHELAGNERSGY